MKVRKKEHKQLYRFLPQIGSSSVPLALPRRVPLLNHYWERDFSMLKDNSKRLLCSIAQERDFYAQGQLQETSFAQSLLRETSMLKDNSKRLPLLNHNWKRLFLTITKNWLMFWILDIQSEVFTKQYEHNILCFSRHLRILRYERL